MKVEISAHEPRRSPLQARSLMSRRRMVEAALRLLDQRDIDQISVRDIVAEGGTSNGSFYHRFGTKERFFSYLIDDMLERREQAAAQEQADETISVAALPEVLARSAIANFRDHAGLLRSAIRLHIVGDSCWDRVNAMARRIVNGYLQRLSGALGRPLSPLECDRIYFAFTWLYGLLAHRTLKLNVVYGQAVPDEVFEEEAVRGFQQLIDRALDPSM